MIPRSGSVSLLKGLSSSMNLKMIGEPFNSHLWSTTPNLDIKNVIIKTFIHQPENEDDIVSFYINMSKNFDKVILISRRNLKESAESYLHNLNYSNIEGWRSPYYFDSTLDTRNYLKWFLRMNQTMGLLSKKIKIEIDWYEDIFSGNESKIDLFLNKHQLDLDKDIFLDYLNPKNRYRKPNPIII